MSEIKSQIATNQMIELGAKWKELQNQIREYKDEQKILMEKKHGLLNQCTHKYENGESAILEGWDWDTCSICMHKF